jgi:hypothetical protein
MYILVANISRALRFSGCPELVNSRRNQEFLVRPPQTLDGRFAPTGAAPVISALKVNNLYRFSTAEIFGATLVNVLLPAAFNVIANTGVKRVIAATDNINLPTHTATRTEPHWRQW